MELGDLKERIAESQKKINTLKNNYQTDLRALLDAEALIIREYIKDKAKYQEGDLVSHRGRICLIGWRELNKDKWCIQYRTLKIKSDGKTGTQLSSYSYPEDEFARPNSQP